MKKARLSRMASGHILATFKDGDSITGTRVVGSPTDKFSDAAKFVATNFDVDQVGIRASDIGPNCTLACASQGYGNTLWLKPTFGR